MNVKFEEFPENVKSVLETNNSAKMNLSRLERGTKDTQRTWFYEDLEPSKVIEPVVLKLRELEATMPEIASMDLSKLDKFMPQGRAAAFADRIEGFDEYFTHIGPPPIVKDAVWQRAKTLAKGLLGFNETGTPLSIGEVVERGISMGKYSTSSGFPDFMKRKSKTAIANATKAAEGNRAIHERYPFMVGSRAQMGKVGKDARFIFMAPMAVNLCGQRYAEPLQDYLTSLSEKTLFKHVTSKAVWKDKDYQDPLILTFFTPWLGWDKVQLVVSRYWEEADLRFGADYTKMDQHFNKYHALEVYDVIKHYFAREYWDEMKECVLYPFTAPIITSEGYVDQEHALLSGSEWTNLLETMWNFIFCIYLSLLFIEGNPRDNTNGFRDIPYFMVPMGIGDDQLWLLVKNKRFPTWNDFINDPAKACKFYVEKFEYAGLPGNEEKQDGVENVDQSAFLQRHFWSDYNGPDGKTPAAGVYPLIRNVTSQVYPERYHNDKEYDWMAFAIRVIMIAENCCTHPLFKWYVTEYIANANINILRFVMQTDVTVDAKWALVKNMAGFRPNYNQEKQDKPLTQFETFKLLREVAQSHAQEVNAKVKEVKRMRAKQNAKYEKADRAEMLENSKS